MTAGNAPMHSGKAWARYLKKKIFFILNRTVASHIKKFLTLLNKLYLQASYHLITLVLPHVVSATAIFSL